MANPEILIFDDDIRVRTLMQHILEDAGYGVQAYDEATRVISLVQEIQPRLVILDIMMPGLDGLAACTSLRENFATKDIYIIVASGKTSGLVEDQARDLGADLFIRKPFEASLFHEQVRCLIGAPLADASKPASQRVRVTVLGCRASGRTSCVALQAGDMLLALDAGAGMRQLGGLLVGRKELRVLLTHYHADHVEGLSFLRDKNLKISVCGPQDADRSVQDVAQQYLFTPTPPKAEIGLYTIGEGSFALAEGVRLSAIYLNHPGTTLGLRVEVYGKRIVYCPDNEVRMPEGGKNRDTEDKLKEFAQDADLLIHDARYSPEDYQRRVNEGHSAYPLVVDLAVDAGVKRLMLFHLDGSYGAAQVKSLEEGACERASRQITSLEILAAQDGMKLQV